jgi:hypothetical protein
MRPIVAFATDVREVPFNRVTTLPVGQTSDLLKHNASNLLNPIEKERGTPAVFF